MTQEQFFLSNFAYFKQNPELDLYFIEEQTKKEFRLHLTMGKFEIFMAVDLQEYKLDPQKNREVLFEDLNKELFRIAFQSKIN